MAVKDQHQADIDEAQARLAAVVMASSDAIVSKTLEGIVTSWNAAAERMFGFPASEMVGQSVRKIIPPDLQHEEDMILAKIANGERLDHYETVRMTRDGRRIDVSVTVSPVHDATGRVIGAAKIARDISERRRSEQRMASIRAAISAEPASNDPFELEETIVITPAGLAPQVREAATAALGVLEGKPDRAFDQTTRLAAGLIQSPTALLAVRHGELIRFISTYGMPAELQEALAVPAEQSYCHLVIESETPVSIRDARNNPVAAPAGLWRHGIESFLGVPIRDRNGIVVASLSVADRTPRTWSLRDLLTLKGIAQQLMRELENRAMLRTLAESEERLRAASAAAGFGIHETRTAANESTWSAELARILGHGSSVMLVPWPGAILAATHPEDRSAMAAHVAQISRIPGPYEREWRIVRPDGSMRWLLDRGETRGPVDPQTGLAAQVTGIIVDITERKLYEEKILMLMREVNHRAKNMLGLVQAMARQTAAATPAEFVSRFSARIQALSATQDLLVQNEWHGIDIRDLVRAHLAVFEDLIGNRIELQGPHVRLTPAAAQGIGLALHELATNAGKYGSLSNDAGKVQVAWDQDGQTFRICWQETGGPPVQEPKKAGFGKTIITYAAETSVEGQSDLAFRPGGVHWSLQCRLSSIVERYATAAPQRALDSA